MSGIVGCDFICFDCWKCGREVLRVAAGDGWSVHTSVNCPDPACGVLNWCVDAFPQATPRPEGTEDRSSAPSVPQMSERVRAFKEAKLEFAELADQHHIDETGA